MCSKQIMPWLFAAMNQRGAHPTKTQLRNRNIELYGWCIQWHKSHFVTVNVKILPTTLSSYASAINNRIHQQANNTLNFISFCVFLYRHFIFIFFSLPFGLSLFSDVSLALNRMNCIQKTVEWIFKIASESLANHWMFVF